MTADTGNYMHLPPKKRNSFEILHMVAGAKTEADRIKVVKEHLAENLPFKQLLMWNFLPRIVTALPQGNPSFIRNKMDGEHHTLWEYIKMFPFFVVSAQSQRMNKIRQEKLFIDMLEAIPEKEAEIVLLAKDGKLEEAHPLLSPGLLLKADPILFAPLEEIKEQRKALAKQEEKQEVDSKDSSNEGKEAKDPEKDSGEVKSQEETPAKRKSPARKKTAGKKAPAKKQKKGSESKDS